jgi:hypothetical protein
MMGVDETQFEVPSGSAEALLDDMWMALALEVRWMCT